eukprot:scaffold28821_cov63-Phaeocystis_antarctica.AAC.5
MDAINILACHSIRVVVHERMPLPVVGRAAVGMRAANLWLHHSNRFAGRLSLVLQIPAPAGWLGASSPWLPSPDLLRGCGT